MVNCKDTRVHDRTKWHFNAFINGLGAKDSCGSNLVVDFSSLVKNEGENVLVV
jgi:hypothetical protein